LEHIYELQRENAQLKEGAKLRDQSERESYDQETQTAPLREPEAKTIVKEVQVVKEVIKEVPISVGPNGAPSNVKESAEYRQLQSQFRNQAS
jgi:hypothetical protein